MAPRTLLGPLTTPFTYPASCLNNVLECSTASDCTVGWQAQTCRTNPVNSQGIGDDTNCWPPVSNGVTQLQPYAVLGWGFYSPAFSCPVGYSTACLASGSQNDGFSFQFELLSGETAVGCCPTGYECGSLYTFSTFQTCIRVVTTGSISTVQCVAEQSVSSAFFHVPATITTSATVETVSSVTLYAPLFQLNRQATDTPTESVGNPSTVTVLSIIDIGGSTTLGSGTATAISSRGGGGLSAGAAGGIGAAAGVVGLLAIRALIWFLWIKRRKDVTTGQDVGQTRATREMAAVQKPELDACPKDVAAGGDPTGWIQNKIAEVPAHGVYEAP